MTAPLDWGKMLAPIENIPELYAFWNDNGRSLPPEEKVRLKEALEKRKSEIDAQRAPAEIGAHNVVTSEQKLENIEEQSYEAVAEYRTALDRAARAEAVYRGLKARKWLEWKATLSEKGGRITDGEADKRTDADEEVNAALLERELADGIVRATRSNLERLEREFQHHRSLLVRERQMEERR